MTMYKAIFCSKETGKVFNMPLNEIQKNNFDDCKEFCNRHYSLKANKENFSVYIIEIGGKNNTFKIH